MRYLTAWIVCFVAGTSASSDSVQPLVTPNIQRRQADTSSTSYDYWWPYGPNGVYATTSAALVPLTSSSSTMIWWTPPPTSTQPPPTPVSTPDSTLVVQSQPLTTSSSTGDASLDATSDSNIATTITSSDSNTGTATSSSSPSSSAVTATPTASSNLSTIRIPQPLKMAYFTPLFLFAALALCVAVGMIITRCKRTSARPSASYLPSLLGGRDDEDEEKDNLRGLFALPDGHLVRENHGFFAWLRSFVLARPTWYNSDVQYTTFGDLGRRRLPPAKRLVNVERDHEDHPGKDQRQDGSYGYGQWMTRRGMASVELTREYSREGDAEEIEIDLSKGWRHFSSLYGGSPDLEDQSHHHNASQSDQRSSSREREGSTEIEEKLTTKPKYSSILNFRLPGMAKSSNKQLSSLKQTTTSTNSGHLTFSPNASTALAIPGSAIRRTSAGNTKTFSLHDGGAVSKKHKREAEIACDELSLNSRPYSLCNYRGDTPPPSSQFLQHMKIQNSLSPRAYEDLYSANSSPDALLIERTPRQPDGAVKHKSIRRLIVEKLRGPGAGGRSGSQERLRYDHEFASPVEEEKDDRERSNESTPMVIGVDRMSFSNAGSSVAPTMESMEPLRIVKKDHRDLLDPFRRELGTTLSPLPSELSHLYKGSDRSSSSPSPLQQNSPIDSSRKTKGSGPSERGAGSYTVALKRSISTTAPQPLQHQKSKGSRLDVLRTDPQQQHSRGASQSRSQAGPGGISRVNTSVSTVPSVYSPASTTTGVGSPLPAANTSRQKSFKAFNEERRKVPVISSSTATPMGAKATGKSLGSAQEMDLTSAAQMSKLSRRPPNAAAAARGTQSISKLSSGKTPVTPLETSAKYSERAEYPFPAPPATRQPPPRAQSPLPELPSGIMSPPLQADLFFSPSLSTDLTSSKHPTKEKSEPNSESKTSDRARSSHASKSSSSGARPDVSSINEGKKLSRTQAPASSATLKVSGAGTGRTTLARTASRATTATSASSSTTATPPPPSHFSFKTRERANLKVDMIVKSGYVSKERPSSPTGFGAKASWDIGRPVEAMTEKGDDNSGTAAKRESTCSSLDVEEVYGCGIEQRLGI